MEPWNRNRVTIPKLPPPPRSPHISSASTLSSTHDRTVGGDKFGGQQVVRRETEPPGQPADPAAEG